MPSSVLKLWISFHIYVVSESCTQGVLYQLGYFAIGFIRQHYDLLSSLY